MYINQCGLVKSQDKHFQMVSTGLRDMTIQYVACVSNVVAARAS